ncbi:MAG TPA: hypothetical protein VGM23_08920 [Armatimonadota bacterium]|jgi:hypothetical protein
MKKAFWLIGTLVVLGGIICLALFGCSSDSMGLRVTSTDWQAAHISWDAVAGATSYNILGSSTLGGVYHPSWASATTSFAIPMTGFPWSMSGKFRYGQVIYVKVESVGGTTTTTSAPLAVTFKTDGHIGCWVYSGMGYTVLNLNANGVYTQYYTNDGVTFQIQTTGEKGTYTVQYDPIGGDSHITLTQTATYNAGTWDSINPPVVDTYTLDLAPDGLNNAPGTITVDGLDYDYEGAPLTP